jgi:hypothetical protein
MTVGLRIAVACAATPFAISLEGSVLGVAVELVTKLTKLGAAISLAPDENNRSAATYLLPR